MALQKVRFHGTCADDAGDRKRGTKHTTALDICAQGARWGRLGFNVRNRHHDRVFHYIISQNFGAEATLVEGDKNKFYSRWGRKVPVIGISLYLFDTFTKFMTENFVVHRIAMHCLQTTRDDMCPVLLVEGLSRHTLSPKPVKKNDKTSQYFCYIFIVRPWIVKIENMGWVVLSIWTKTIN